MHFLAGLIATAAFACYVLGLLLVLAAPWYFFMMAARLIRREPARGSWLNMVLFALLVIGVLGGMIWSVARSQTHSKQAEAEMNLTEFYTRQSSFFIEHKAYAGTADEAGSCFNQLGWDTSVMWLYTYYCGDDSAPMRNNQKVLDRPHGDLPEGVPRSEVSVTGFTIVAIGNIDRDEALDIWTINDANVMVNVVNDFDLISGNQDPFITAFRQELYDLQFNPFRLAAAIITPILILSLLRDRRRAKKAKTEKEENQFI